jgi:hypothetical protein
MRQNITDATTETPTIAKAIPREKKRISCLQKQHVKPSTKVVFMASVPFPKQFVNVRHTLTVGRNM